GEVRTAATAAALSARAGATGARKVLRSIPAGWRNSVMPAERRVYEHDGEEIEISYRTHRDGTVDFDGGTVRVLEARDGWVDFEECGETPARHRFHVHRSGLSVWVQGGNGDVLLTERPRFPDPAGETVVPGGLVAPMPGKVVAVSVNTGDVVEGGDLLMIVEAMKMEHRVLAPHSGVIGELRASVGDQVNAGDLLVVIADHGQHPGEEGAGR
ncbi:MAG TPA: biotin/lipoyl-containing protein, partial [Acidimicrobiales bacterium]|nr:biotin/lipoyl-containing protein [Acidimicrobiales bacterium]